MRRAFFVGEAMGRNPNWCSDANEMSPPSFEQTHSSSQEMISHPSIIFSEPPNPWQNNSNQISDSWTKLLMSGGLSGNPEESQSLDFQYHQYLASSSSSPPLTSMAGHESFVYNDSFVVDQALTNNSPWSTSTQKVTILPVSSPRSCVTTSSFSTNMLDFSKQKPEKRQPDHPDQSSNPECNSTSSGEAFKKSKVHASCAQSPFKVRKEKLGERITALHQLVSPFGKTDTASVLLEAIGYIRFLHGQIEALSSPYLGSRARVPPTSTRHQGAHETFEESKTTKDLRSQGLCLAPVSCTLDGGGGGEDVGADYWAPIFGAGFR